MATHSIRFGRPGQCAQGATQLIRWLFGLLTRDKQFGIKSKKARENSTKISLNRM
jgi:hypothetical protein